MIRKTRAAKRETMVNVTLGPDDDDCEICRAQRAGMSTADIVKGIKAGTIKGNAVILETEGGQ